MAPQCVENAWWWLSRNDCAGDALAWGACGTDDRRRKIDSTKGRARESPRSRSSSGHDGGRSGRCVKQVVFSVLHQLSQEFGSAEGSVDLNVHFTPARCIPVYKHLSQMHQRIRVGSRLSRKTEFHLSLPFCLFWLRVGRPRRSDAQPRHVCYACHGGREPV